MPYASAWVFSSFGVGYSSTSSQVATDSTPLFYNPVAGIRSGKKTKLFMKKMFLYTAYAVLLTSLISISSCAKKGCTDQSAPNYDPTAKSDDGSCTDLTASIVGTYTGAYTDSTIGGGSPTINNSPEQISITKVSDSQIQITDVSATPLLPTFKASVSLLSNGNYSFTVSNQTSPTGNVSIVTYNSPAGAYSPTTKQFTIAIISSGTDIEGFVGTHQ
jgi:hypothetical protein